MARPRHRGAGSSNDISDHHSNRGDDNAAANGHNNAANGRDDHHHGVAGPRHARGHTSPAPATPEATSPAPTVVPNPDVIKVLAIGDSVMLGAAEELVAAGVTVDAAESRHGLSIIEPLGMISAAGRLGSAVVIHLGTNGPTSQETLDAIMGSLVNVPAVIVLTGHFDRGWMAGNNERVRALPALYPNVTVLDWDVLAGHRTCHRIVIDDPPVGVRGVPVLAHFVEQSSELGRA